MASLFAAKKMNAAVAKSEVHHILCFFVLFQKLVNEGETLPHVLP
jgi:hypothetical protein